ncbi:MAG: hypothetical protein WBF42_02950, partial [Terracidiphilus sp.]
MFARRTLTPHLDLKRIFGLTLAAISMAAVVAPAQQSMRDNGKPRVVITADPELDDNNTIIRAILY